MHGMKKELKLVKNQIRTKIRDQVDSIPIGDFNRVSDPDPINSSVWDEIQSKVLILISFQVWHPIYIEMENEKRLGFLLDKT